MTNLKSSQTPLIWASAKISGNDILNGKNGGLHAGDPGVNYT